MQPDPSSVFQYLAVLWAVVAVPFIVCLVPAAWSFGRARKVHAVPWCLLACLLWPIAFPLLLAAAFLYILVTC